MPLPSSNKVKRRNRRKLGRDQYPITADATVVVTSTGTTNATLTYSKPVVVRGIPAISIATLTVNSFAHPSPNVVTVVASGNVATHAYTVAANDPNVSPSTGGGVAGTSGTF